MEHVTQLTAAAERAEAKRNAEAHEDARIRIAELEKLLRKYAPTNCDLELAALDKRLASAAAKRASAMALARPGRDP